MKAKLEKFLNWFYHKYNKLHNLVKSEFLVLHQFCVKKDVYRKLTIELLSIIGTGFAISIALIPFGVAWRPWLALSYGLVPYILIRLLVYGKRELSK